MISSLKQLFETTFETTVDSIEPIREDGSERALFRLTGGGRTAVGVSHTDRRENAAFVGFTRHFRSMGLPVPEIFALSPEDGIYLETDLGDETLADRIVAARQGDERVSSVDILYEKAIRALPHFQIRGHQGLDYSLCYQYDRFAPETVEHDLRYFRDSFLDLIYTGPRDDARLDREGEAIANYLAGAPADFFLYRDYQVRNMMVLPGEEICFIDYQSGRRGALQYDLAAFLYSSRSGIGNESRPRWIDIYIEEASRLITLDETLFRAHLPGFAFIRILQALGAYANLGINRGKSRFLKGIPGALRNLNHLMDESELDSTFPAYNDILKRMIDSPSQYCKVPYDE